MAKISIIVPIFNMEDYLECCLNSVTIQTLNELEIICIDDASEDNSLRLLKEYKEKDSRIIIKSLPQNLGSGIARNIGIDIATGEFVSFLDPDDFYPDIKVLETMYDAAKKHRVKICGGSMIEYRDNCYKKNYQGYSRGFVFKDNEKKIYKKYQFEYGYVRFIYDRNFLKKNNIYFGDLRRFQDPPFFVKAMSIAKEFYALSTVTYCYRTGYKEINWNHSNTNDFAKGILEIIKLTHKYSLHLLRKNIVIQMNEVYYFRLKNNIKNNYELIEILLNIDALIDNPIRKKHRKYKDDVFALEVLNEYIRMIKKRNGMHLKGSVNILYLLNKTYILFKNEKIKGVLNILINELKGEKRNV